MAAVMRTAGAALAPQSHATAPSIARSEVAVCPTLSVVIPCYNGAATLPDTLRSLRRQSFRDWEAIVVDDGSTDESAAIVEAWARSDRRIRLLRADHGGVAAAWNHGLAAASGNWLAFLDCDDWLARDAYARLLALAAARPSAGVVMGGCSIVLPNGQRRLYDQPDLSDAFGQLCYQGGIAIHSAILRRDLALAVGGFDAALATHEDWDFWQRLARSGVEFAQTDKVVAFYRARPGSLSRRVWQFAVDGLEVMGRGHAPDPRVRQAPAVYANGAPRQSLPMHRLYFGLWSAARDIAAGGDGLAIVGLLDGDPHVEFEPRGLGELMASGMADMAACPPAELAPRWDEFAPKLEALFERVGPGPEWARLKALALGVIKAGLNAGGPNDEDALDLDWPRVPALGEADRPMVMQLRRGGRTLGAIALAALGPMSASRFAEMVAAQAERLPRARAVRALAPWRSFSFWRAASASLLRPVPTAALRQGREVLRARLRTATGAGVRAMVAERLRRAPAPPGGEVHDERLLALETATGASRPAEIARPGARDVPRRPAAPVGSYSVSVPILMYHRVAATGGLPRYRVAPDQFARQMRLLQSAGYRTIDPDELAQGLASGRPFPGRPVLLTFDDGYDDFYEQAWPLLHASGFTATVFAVGGRMGGCADWDAEYGEPASLMSAARLAELDRAGITIGSHAFNHRRVTRLDVAELYREALASSATIEAVTGSRPTAFCYPYGAHDPVAEQAIEESGYRLAMTTMSGVATLASPPMRLPRVEISGLDDLQAFSRKLLLP